MRAERIFLEDQKACRIQAFNLYPEADLPTFKAQEVPLPAEQHVRERLFIGCRSAITKLIRSAMAGLSDSCSKT